MKEQIIRKQGKTLHKTAIDRNKKEQAKRIKSIETNRQIGTQTNQQIGTQTNWQIGTQTNRQIGTHTNGMIEQKDGHEKKILEEIDIEH